MSIIRSLIIAFSSYSKIPMPQFAWKDSDMKYVMSFFPAVGAVIGALEYVWYVLSEAWNVGEIAFCMISVLIPVLVTGGFHVDGFMDTSDAISSYRDREKRLEILKDSHVGAFAVIRLMTAAGVFVAAVSMIRTNAASLVFALGFVLSRSLSALAVLHFPSAVHQGSLFYTSSNSSRKINTISTGIISLASAVLMICIFPLGGILAVCGAAGSFVWYRIMSMRKFGGITGDLAGYFVVICEVSMAVCIAAGVLIL